MFYVMLIYISNVMSELSSIIIAIIEQILTASKVTFSFVWLAQERRHILYYIPSVEVYEACVFLYI